MDGKCDRCGEVGNDRRTLWMACLYQMSEMQMPFKEVAIFGQPLKKIGEKPSAFGPYAAFEDPKQGTELRRHCFYTLYVCKDCRADWMNAIESWFNTASEKMPEGDIPVRVNGRTIMVTEEGYASLIARGIIRQDKP